MVLRINGLILCIMFIICEIQKSDAYRAFKVDGVDVVLAMEHEKITFECKKDVPMSYCGFIHPNGSRFSFTGEDLNAGHCSIKIIVTTNDNGEWKCHIGLKEPGLETVQRKLVRVTDRLATVQQNVTTKHGRDVTLHCATVERMMPLTYCRFEPPVGAPFSINSDITAKNPIMGRYHFPENKSLDRGDCAVTIKGIRDEDMGTWMCGAGLDVDSKEYLDAIDINVIGLFVMTTASATGIAFGVILIMLMLGIIVMVTWKKRRERAQQARNSEAIEVQELGVPSPDMPQGSPHSARSVPALIVQSPSNPSISAVAP